MKKLKKAVLLAAAGLVPLAGKAQGIAGELGGLRGVLEGLYDEMMPLCSNLIGVAQGLAGFAALFYIANRVWRHLANAEPIDFYPLFRPFVLGFCIMLFPSVLDLINGVMKPTVTATGAMVAGSNRSIEVLLQKKEQAVRSSDAWDMLAGAGGEGDREKWEKYTQESGGSQEGGLFERLDNGLKFGMAKLSFSFRNTVKEWLSEVLQIVFQAAALCIDTLRTFQLVVLSILGPLVFGLAVFDGLHHTLTAWLARYINVFLWLPVANIFGSIIGRIQEKMLALDIEQIGEHGDTIFSRTDMGYMIFLIIGIVGYFTVPSIASFIVQAGGGGLQQKVTNMMGSAASGAASAGAAMATGGASRMAEGAVNLARAPFDIAQGYRGGDSSGHQGDRLKGNS
ncbi:conjugative transposon protein TraJ [Sphingobacterium siyangense]|uniref:conjugative transposon protein TraJ n=1 Tax=Sphingobacterium siyangense TaxID=459529 RepID=UPI002FD87C8A